MQIPYCLKDRLDPECVAACDKWLEQFKLPNSYDECCCGSGLTIHIMPSGIGDSIWVEVHGRKFYLCRDDDNEIMGESRWRRAIAANASTSGPVAGTAISRLAPAWIAAAAGDIQNYFDLTGEFAETKTAQRLKKKIESFIRKHAPKP